jgi:hypothetical protein
LGLLRVGAYEIVFSQDEPSSFLRSHSFGGVQHQQFPDIAPELHDPNNTLSVAHFDTTFAQFDNNVCVFSYFYLACEPERG